MTFEIISVPEEEKEQKNKEKPSSYAQRVMEGKGSLKDVIAHPKENLKPVGLAAKGALEGTVGSVMDLKNFVNDLISSGVKTVTDTDISKYLEKVSGPNISSKDIKSGVEKAIPSLTPMTPKEEKIEEGSELFSSLANPLLGEARLGKAAVGTFLGLTGKEIAKKAGAGEDVQDLVKYGLGGAPSLFRTAEEVPLVQRLANDRQRRTYLAGRQAGLTEEEMIPLLQEPAKARRAGRYTEETERNRGQINAVRESENRLYRDVRARGRAVPISPNSARVVIDEATTLRNQLANVQGQEPTRQAVVRYLDGLINDLQHGNFNAESLINTYQDINHGFRENQPALRNLLQGVNRSIITAIYRENPALARDFRHANRLVQARENFLHNVGWESLERSQRAGTEAQTVLAGVAGEILGGTKGAAAAVAGRMGLSGLTNALLTRPGWQTIRRTTIRALREESPKLASLAVKQIKEKMKKELPDEYELIEWPSE